MKRQDVEAYLRRDWGLLTARAARSVAQRKVAMGLVEAFRIGERLRRHARMLHPEWPTRQQRRADLASHIRLSRLLARARATR